MGYNQFLNGVVQERTLREALKGGVSSYRVERERKLLQGRETFFLGLY